jgi:hypothetical protein
MNENMVLLIKDWVKLDNEIKKLQSEATLRKKNQKILSNSLMELMKENNIDEFDLKDGKIKYNKRNVKKPLTKKALLDILSKYYNDNDKANEVNDYILDNREITVVESITRNSNRS